MRNKAKGCTVRCPRSARSASIHMFPCSILVAGPLPRMMGNILSSFLTVMEGTPAQRVEAAAFYARLRGVDEKIHDVCQAR